ncbi:unnamed protein product, partial [Amoebophrya sp. A25]
MIKNVVVENRRTLFHAYYLAFLVFFCTSGVLYLTERRNGNLNEIPRYTNLPLAATYTSRLFTGNMGMAKEYS